MARSKITAMTTVLEAISCPRCDTKFTPKSAKHKYCSKECREAKPAPAVETAAPEPAKQPEFTLTDPSNHILAVGPSVMTCGLMKTEEGIVLVLTVRTASTTVTVGLSQKEASGWLTELALNIREMQNEEAKAAPAQEAEEG